MKGNEFRAIREHLGLGREEMAELLGLSGYTSVSNIELGHRNPSQLAAMLLRALKSLPQKRAMELMNLLKGFQK